MSYQKVFVVIPVYNEGRHIRRVITSLLRRKFKDIVVVDDFSTDNTLEILDTMNIPITARHCVNRGQGAALQTGTELALENGAEYIVHFDGDGQHSVQDIHPALDLLDREKVDIVLGSRYLRPGTQRQIPVIKKVLTKGGLVFTKMMTPQLSLTDTHNGFRVLTRKAAQLLSIHHDRMEHASEIIDKIARLNLKYSEIPVHINYSKDSLRNGTNTPLNALNIAFKFILSKIV